MTVMISVEQVSKYYRLGVIGSRTLSGDLNRWWARLRGKPDPLLKIGEADHGNREGDFIWALRKVDFQVLQGEVLGIIGRNGAGKSTLLKILSRVTAPTNGQVRTRGRIASLLEVGTGFHPELTGRENIYLNGAILGMKRREINCKFDEIVDFSGVEQFIDTPVKRYSSGMYVRLAFAVAAHLEPEILLVDEVLAVGDAAFQKKCLGKMEEVSQGEGRTVLFVSHNMAAIRSLCRRAVWLDKGEIIEVGETENIIKNYLQKSTHSLVEQVWEGPETAPGNDQVRIRSARVSSLPEEAEDRRIFIDTPIQMEFEVWNNLPEMTLNFVIHFLTIEGTFVFAGSSDSRPRPQGLVKAVVKIPPNLLNDGTYRVNLQIVQSDLARTVYLHSDILVFDVYEPVREGNWFGKWQGVIRPQLDWYTEDASDLKRSP